MPTHPHSTRHLIRPFVVPVQRFVAGVRSGGLPIGRPPLVPAVRPALVSHRRVRPLVRVVDRGASHPGPGGNDRVPHREDGHRPVIAPRPARLDTRAGAGRREGSLPSPRRTGSVAAPTAPAAQPGPAGTAPSDGSPAIGPAAAPLLAESIGPPAVRPAPGAPVLPVGPGGTGHRAVGGHEVEGSTPSPARTRTVLSPDREPGPAPGPLRDKGRSGAQAELLPWIPPSADPRPTDLPSVRRSPAYPIGLDSTVVVRRGPEAEELTRRTGSRAATADGVVYLPARHGNSADPAVRGLLAHELVHASFDRRTALPRPSARDEERVADHHEAAVRQGVVRGPQLDSVTPVPAPASLAPEASSSRTAGEPLGPAGVSASGPANPVPAASVHRAPEAPPPPQHGQDDPGEGERFRQLHRLVEERLRDEALLVRERTGALTDLVWG